MSKNLTDLNAEPPPDDGSGLRGGTQAGDRENTEDASSGGRTKPSPEVATQRARDAVHVPGTHSGIDEGNPKQVPDDHPEDVV